MIGSRTHLVEQDLRSYRRSHKQLFRRSCCAKCKLSCRNDQQLPTPSPLIQSFQLSFFPPLPPLPLKPNGDPEKMRFDTRHNLDSRQTKASTLIDTTVSVIRDPSLQATHPLTLLWPEECQYFLAFLMHLLETFACTVVRRSKIDNSFVFQDVWRGMCHCLKIKSHYGN